MTEPLTPEECPVCKGEYKPYLLTMHAVEDGNG